MHGKRSKEGKQREKERERDIYITRIKPVTQVMVLGHHFGF